MKRFVGLLLALAGGAAALWGGYYVFTGQSDAQLTVTPDFAIPAATAGLVGLVAFTVGLVWARE